MADFAVSTSFLAIDRVSKAFGKMTKNANRFGDRASRAFNKASRPASRFSDILKGILGANLIRGGFAAITRGIREVGEQFITLDDAMVSAGAKFKDVNLLTEEGRKRLEQLTAAARDMGATTEFTATQAGQALDFLALAGFDSEQAVASLQGTVDLATIGQLDLARASDIASDALGIFNLMTGDANQLQINFTRLNDVMARTMSRTNTNLEDMFETMKVGGPVMLAAGQSLESFNAMLGIMASAGVKASMAGTAIRGGMIRLADPPAEAAKALASMNIKIQDSSKNFRDIVDILADVELGIKGMGSREQLAILAKIFGVKAATPFIKLLQIGAPALRTFRNELLDAGGSMEIMASIMRTSLGNQLRALQSAALETGFKIFDAFVGQGRSAILMFTDVLRNLDVAPIVAILKDLVKIFGALFAVVKPLFLAVLPIAVGVLGALAALFGKLTPLLQPLIGALLIFLTVMKAIAIVQAIVAATNPFLLAIIGASLLAAGIIWLIENWEIVEAALIKGAKAIGRFFKDLWDDIRQRFLLFVATIAFGLAKVGAFIGLDTSALEKFADEAVLSAAPPNKTEIETRQQATFSGELNIVGAPAQSTISTRQANNANVNINLAGANQ